MNKKLLRNPSSLTFVSYFFGSFPSRHLNRADGRVPLPGAKDPLAGPGLEENQAFIQTLVGENSKAISTLTRLLQTPYRSWDVCSTIPITAAILKLHPL